MAITTTTVMDNSVVTAYKADYLRAFQERQVWYRLVTEKMRREVNGQGARGLTIQIPVYEPLAVPTAHLSETNDVTPQAAADSYVSCTIYEEGDAVQTTYLLEAASYVKLGQPIAEMLAAQAAERIDRLIRYPACFLATNVIRPNNATRAGLDLTNDKFNYNLVTAALARASAMGIPSFPDGSYVTVVHPALAQDIKDFNSSVWVNVAQYSDPTLIVSGDYTVLGKGGRWPGEVGRIGNLRFIEHPLGKLFLGAGTPAQSATTLSAAASAGATVITVASATGITVGDWITIGTVESGSTEQPTTEQVQVLAVNTNDLTIRGAGNAFNNWGLKFAHASGSAVVEAPNVACIPILGPESMIVAYDGGIGPNPRTAIEWASTVIPQRFHNYSWYWIGGANLVDKNVITIEVACSGYVFGNA